MAGKNEHTNGESVNDKPARKCVGYAGKPDCSNKPNRQTSIRCKECATKNKKIAEQNRLNDVS